MLLNFIKIAGNKLLCQFFFFFFCQLNMYKICCKINCLKIIRILNIYFIKKGLIKLNQKDKKMKRIIVLFKERETRGIWYILHVAIFSERALFVEAMRLVAYGPEFHRDRLEG